MSEHTAPQDSGTNKRYLGGVRREGRLEETRARVLAIPPVLRESDSAWLLAEIDRLTHALTASGKVVKKAERDYGFTYCAGCGVMYGPPSEDGTCGRCDTYDPMMLRSLQQAHRDRDDAIREQRRLTHALTAAEAREQALRDHLHNMVGAVQWMSGSTDFGPEGQAYEGWLKERELLFAAMAALEQQKLS